MANRGARVTLLIWRRAHILGSVDKTTAVALAYRYKETVGKPLIESLSDELSGDFLDACVSWVSAEAARWHCLEMGGGLKHRFRGRF